jgi:predicted dienelactone hydrolase
VLIFAACSSSNEPAVLERTPADPTAAAQNYAERGPHGVGVTTVVFVDPTRPTPANRDYAGAPDRSLSTEIWYPSGEGFAQGEARDVPFDESGAPYPLIVFSHGYGSFNRQSASYAQHLASHGYVVVSPMFPGTNTGTSGGPRLHFTVDQPPDISFILDELATRSSDDSWAFAHAIDLQRIGLTGHSLGGLTTMLTLYGDLRDDRIDAGVAISPFACLLTDDLAATSQPKPLMVIGGSKDILVGPASIRTAYDVAPEPKYWVEIIGADHTRFTDVDIEDTQIPNIVAELAQGTLIEDVITLAGELGGNVAACADRSNDSTDTVIEGARQRELLRLSATPFFDAYLRDDAPALTIVQRSLSQIEGVHFESSLLD